MGVGNDPVYVKTACFETFPFPNPTESQKTRIRDLAEQLDAHRKRQLAAHADLTMTGLYNVLEKLRSGDPLTPKERVVHEHGLVSVLKQLHDDLDAAVFAAYAWPPDLSDPDLLTRLVALNAQRATEEAGGVVRYLRPEYQESEVGGRKSEDGNQKTEVGERRTEDGGRKTDESEVQNTKPATRRRKKSAPASSPSSSPNSDLRPPTSASTSSPTSDLRLPTSVPRAWPPDLPSQVAAIKSLLPLVPHPPTPESLAPHFLRTKPSKIAPILEALKVMGVA